jgi:ribokinase
VASTVYSFGSILVDVTVEVPALPPRGGDVLASGARTNVGGGFNLAAAVARQGVRCVYAAPHGTGRYGDLIREALAADGIEVSARRRPEGDSGFCVTLVEPDGERTFVTVAGVEGALSPEDLAAVAPVAGDLISVTGYDLLYPGTGPVLAGWLESLPGHVRVALDPGPLILDIPADRLAGVLSRLAVLTLNQREARLLVGLAKAEVEGESGSALLDAVRRVVPAASTLVVVREGADGCVAGGGALDDRVVSVAAPKVRAVDTTGAGDSHTGVLLAGLAGLPDGHDGHDLDAVLVDAVRAAAVSVTRIGSATTPTRAELAGGAGVR